MKKILPLTALFLSSLFFKQGYAQLKGFSVGPYIEFGSPKGEFAKHNGNGLGIGVGGDFKLMKKLSVMGSFGYMRFGREGGLLDGKNSVVSAIPIRAGIKYKLPLVYVKIESGVAKFNNDLPNALILSPGIGLRILGLDIQGSYESWLGDEGRSYAALRLAYHF